MNYVTMVLLDKGYFDYDFEKIEKPKPVIDWKDTIKTDEEVRGILAGFGFKRYAEHQQMTTEQIQEHIIKQENYGRE